MFTIGGWLAAVMPTLAGSHGQPLKMTAHRPKNGCPLTARNAFPPYRSIVDFVDDNTLATVARVTAHDGPSDCPVDAQHHPTESQSVAARLAPTDGRRLRFVVDVSRSAPHNPEEAAEQFVELMREAVARGYLPATVPFADLRRFYDAIASEFDWPKIFYVHLSKLFERNGCTKTVKRDRRDGKDKRTVGYLLK